MKNYVVDDDILSAEEKVNEIANLVNGVDKLINIPCTPQDSLWYLSESCEERAFELPAVSLRDPGNLVFPVRTAVRSRPRASDRDYVRDRGYSPGET